jgi:hypothetical protein
MKINPEIVIPYIVLLIVPFLLMWCHNLLLSRIEPFNQQLVITGKINKRLVSLILFIATVGFILFFAPNSQQIFITGYGLFALSFALISSFLIVHYFQELLKDMRGNKQVFRFLKDKNLILFILFVVGTELVILYWLKEVDIYVQKPFWFFVMGYSVLIAIGNIFLGFSKKIVREQWRLSVVTIIDPIIVLCFSGLFLKMLLDVFDYFYS